MDIDIDVPNRDKVLSLFTHIKASRINDGKLVPHNTGVYFHTVPVFARENLCGTTYNSEEANKFFKIDFLNVSIYDGIRDESHLDTLMNTEPLWELLEQKDFCDLIFHVHGYHDLVKKLRPKSVEELAMFLAVLRPSKKHLQKKIENSGWSSIKDEIWEPPTDGSYYFKHSHSIAYSLAIVVQMNKLCELYD